MAEKQKKGEGDVGKKTAQKPEKDAGKSQKGAHGKDPWKVIKHPHLAEKSMNMVEFDNKLTFIVRKNATKTEIKDAVQNLFDVKVVRVHTEITPKGTKKAYAKLSDDHSASEIASRLGMV